MHGNEISSSDAALVTAYHLLAARNDKMIADVLANVLVVICPLQNPDGRNRFIHDYEINEGLEPDPNPLAAEHTESWPGGRTNHYYFDLNRDWIGITQPETIGHVKALQEWYPQVFIDLHEMGTDATYYFTPESDPYNPYLTKEQHDDLYWFGKNNAKYFDQFGFRYFTRENYDAFYPGYGASWPFYYGGLVDDLRKWIRRAAWWCAAPTTPPSPIAKPCAAISSPRLRAAKPRRATARNCSTCSTATRPRPSRRRPGPP